MTGPTSNLPGAAPAVDSELMLKRAAFIKWAKDRALDVTEDADAWGARKFVHPHIESMWTGWFNAPATPVVTDTSLLELRCQLWASKVSGAPVTLSHLAAGALHSAMATPPAPGPSSEAMHEARASLDEALASDELRQLKAEAKALAADGANWSMHVGCIFFLAMIERIESLAAAPPAGYIANADLVKLGNCRAELWAAPPAADAVALFRAPPDAMLHEFLSIIHDGDLAVGDRLQRVASRISFYCKVPTMEEDPVDIIRTLLHTVDHYWALPDDKRECYPSPTSEFSPLMQAARRACVERGFTAGGLAIEPAGRAP